VVGATVVVVVDVEVVVEVLGRVVEVLEARGTDEVVEELLGGRVVVVLGAPRPVEGPLEKTPLRTRATTTITTTTASVPRARRRVRAAERRRCSGR
jgi:hypothetical protein